ncbi:MAG: hydroxyacid dehydrogenase [Litoreibacter sp.]|nr:hydroxyacid dehydrogenase [Litoreibacter sp.]
MDKVVISEFMDEAAVEDLRGSFDVIYDPTLVEDPDRLAQELADADAIILRNRTQLRGPLLEAATALKAVGRLGVGLDNIDLEACKARGISVHPASGANDVCVTEYVIACALALYRSAIFGRERMIAGEWPRQEMTGQELSDKCLGLVGFGSISRATAMRARALGMEVAAFDPFVPADSPVWGETRRHEDLSQLMAEADVISIHVPLTDETRHLIDANMLAKAKPEAILINAARGGVVDEVALVDALRAGKLHGAALDVFETEPLTAEAGAKFNGIGNLILTPHIAGLTGEANIRVSALTVQNIRDALSG